MKMTTTFFLIAGVVGGIMLCTPNSQQNPLMDIEVSVVDETGSPVEDATIKVGYYHWTSKSFWRIVPSPWKKNASDFITSQSRVTNKHGTQRFAFHTRDPRATISVNKDGWYPSMGQLDDRMPINGRWTKNRIKTCLTLKPIVNPIEPLQCKMDKLKYPLSATSGDPIEFDMFEKAWMPPHGNGKHADMRVSVVKSKENYDKKDMDNPFFLLPLNFQEKGMGSKVYLKSN